LVWPTAQLAAHAPLAHAGVGALQALPQALQFWGSLLRSTQTPPHAVVPVGQAHLPLAHAWVAGQALPQPPQFCASRVRSAQVPLQNDVPPGQLLWQTPPRHAWPAPQAMPQPPQFVGSLCVSTTPQPGAGASPSTMGVRSGGVTSERSAGID
jgi:hypothetical protein